MGTSAFILGFFVALGSWTAGKITKQVDVILHPSKIEKTEKVEKAEIKEEENDRRN